MGAEQNKTHLQWLINAGQVRALGNSQFERVEPPE